MNDTGARKPDWRVWTPCAALAILLVLTAAPGAAGAETFAEALAAAYANNPTLRAQRAQLRATDEGLAEARSGWRPTVTASGSAGYSDTDTITSLGVRSVYSQNPISYGVDISQPIYSGGRTVAGTSRAKNLILAERARLVSVEQSVLLSAATVYIDLLRAGAILELNVKNEQVLRRELDATRDRSSVGDATQTDVSQAEARLAQAVAGRIEAQASLDSFRATYLRAIGVAPDSPQPAPALRGVPASSEESLTLTQENNPDLVAARYREAAARNDVSAATGAMLPTVSLNGSVERSDDLTSDSVSDSASITAQLTVPLYQAGGASARVRQAKQIASQRRIQVEEKEQLVREQSSLAWEQLESALARVTQFKIQVRANEIALAGTRQEALHGLRILIDVLNAEQELLDAQVNLVGAQRDSFVAKLQLLAAIGRLTGRDLALPVEYYDEEAYYNKVKGKIWGTGIGSQE